jgi:F-type H+-transporting ATPase subunit alpha
MKINPQEISQIIKDQIKDFQRHTDMAKVGIVVQAGDGIVQIYGLKEAMASELLVFPNDVMGMVLNLDEETVGACIFGEDRFIKEGDIVKLTGRVAEVEVGNELLSRIVNGIGQPIDDKGNLKTKKARPIETIAPGVVTRQPVKEPLYTGIKAIDSMIPIGRGQRELVIGDRQTGKTAIALDAIINQRGKGVVCVYVAIGQKNSSVARVINTLNKHKAMDYTIIVSATAGEPAPLQYLAPYTGCAIAEEFRDKGKDALIIYDDLTKHAQCYREMALLLKRPPGREAYPGDIFYAHSRLLERACKFSQAHGGGSLTAIPIIETQAGDVTTYIPTNVISITDGQIYLESGLFYRGIRPAVNVGLSVSRVGGNAQISAMRQVAGSMRLELAQFREMEAFTQFGTELDKATLKQLERGRRLTELLKQSQYEPMAAEEQVALLYCGVNGFLDDIKVKDIIRFEAEFLSYLHNKHLKFLSQLKAAGKISSDLSARLTEIIEEFKKNFINSD